MSPQFRVTLAKEQAEELQKNQQYWLEISQNLVFCKSSFTVR